MATSGSTEGEKRILADAPRGELVDLRDLRDAERVVSADVIRVLCVGPDAMSIDPRGIRIRGARIDEPLDLSYCSLSHPLRFEATTFDATPDLTDAQAPAIAFECCTLPGLEATLMRLDANLVLRSSAINGEVQLFGAKLGGQLDCGAATLRNEQGSALTADQADVNGVLLDDGFRAVGEVRLNDARIGGSLRCVDASLSNPDGIALYADGAEIKGAVFLAFGFEAEGEVRFIAARIGGELRCEDATLTNRGGWALVADLADVGAGVILSGVKANGEVRFVGARLGQLTCDSGTLENEAGAALIADQAEIDNGFYLNDGFATAGAVRINGTRIQGQLACRGATLDGGNGDALNGEHAEVSGSVFLGDGFEIRGAVELFGAKVGGQVLCRDGTLSQPEGVALSADGLDVRGGVFLRHGFNANGAVSLGGATIGAQFDCTGATLQAPAGENTFALLARDCTVGSALTFSDVEVTGGVDLSRARATTLVDDLGRNDGPLGSWQSVRPLVLDDFAYARFAHEAVWDSRSRQRWLEHSARFEQGAWQQLIRVYRAHGRDDDATRAAIAMQNDRLRRGGLPWYRRAGRVVLWAVVGHGYRAWLAGAWAAGITLAFALAVWHWPGMFVPKQGVTGAPQPVAYAADSFLPIVDLGQAEQWTPTGWMRWIDWSVVLLGWALTTLFVAGFTRIVRNE